MSTTDAEVTKLERLLNAADLGPLRSGYLLDTPTTLRWSEEQRERAHADEICRVFSRFTGRDLGRSRVLFAQCRLPEHAALIVAAVNSLPRLLAAEKIAQAAKALQRARVNFFNGYPGGTETACDEATVALMNALDAAALTPAASGDTSMPEECGCIGCPYTRTCTFARVRCPGCIADGRELPPISSTPANAGAAGAEGHRNE